MTDSLYNRIYDAKQGKPAALSDQEKSEIFTMTTKGCRAPTKSRVSRFLDLPLSLWKNHGIYSRVTFDRSEKYAVTYICGQSWPDEMRTLRECITGEL